MFNRTAGLIAGILYATTILPTALAQAASHDVALVPWINLSLLLLWESHRTPARGQVQFAGTARGCFAQIGPVAFPPPLHAGGGILPRAVDPDQGSGGRGRGRIGLRRLVADNPARRLGGAAPRRGRSAGGRTGRRAVVSGRRTAEPRTTSATTSSTGIFSASPRPRSRTPTSPGGTICRSCWAAACLGSAICRCCGARGEGTRDEGTRDEGWALQCPVKAQKSEVRGQRSESETPTSLSPLPSPLSPSPCFGAG